MAKLSNSFTKNLRRDEILVPHLNTWFQNGVFPDEIPFSVHMNKEKDDAFHPSSALKCSQEIFALRRGDLPDEMIASDSQKNFMVGHMYHGLLQWIIVEGLGFAEWDDIEKEFDFKFDTPAGNPYRVRGFLDVAQCTVPNRGEYLVDVKTMNSRIYSTGLPDSMYAKYSAQVKLYLEFVDLDDAIILCVEKDTPHRFKEILIKRDTAFVEETVVRWESVVDALTSGEVPDCTCSNPSKCPAKGLYPHAFVT